MMKSVTVACRNCGRLIDSQGLCGCPEEDRRRSGAAGWCIVGAAITLILALLLCVGCAPERARARPFMDVDLMAHDMKGRSSYAATGVTFYDPETGCSVDIGPAMRWDFGRDGMFGNAVPGAAFHVRFGAKERP